MASARFSRSHVVTLAVGGVWVLAVILLQVNLGLAAFAAAAFLVLVRAGEDAAMLRQVPWGVIVMVCGVSTLIGVLEGTGGMELFSTALARVATPNSVNGVIARDSRGSGGFGYDPLFVVDGFEGRAMAELSDEEKNRISHRARATSAMKPLILALLAEQLDEAERIGG